MRSRFNHSSFHINALAVLAAVAFVAAVRAESPGASPNQPATIKTAALHTRATSSTALTVASASTGSSISVTLVATVDGKAGAAPGGSVVFTAQGKQIGEAPVVHGSASLTVGALPSGLSDLAAAYRGDNSFLPSKSVTIHYYEDDDQN